MGKHLECINSLPDGFMSRGNMIYFTSVDSRYDSWRMREYRRVPENRMELRDKKILKEIKDYNVTLSAFNMGKEKTEKELKLALVSISTLKQLKERMPEIFDFMGFSLEKPEASQLPAILYNEVTRKLNIEKVV